MNVEKTAKVKPEGGCELGTAIRGDSERYTKPRDPCVWIRADAQLAVVVEERGIALGQWEVWSITVRRMYNSLWKGKGGQPGQDECEKSTGKELK